MMRRTTFGLGTLALLLVSATWGCTASKETSSDDQYEPSVGGEGGVGGAPTTGGTGGSVAPDGGSGGDPGPQVCPDATSVEQATPAKSNLLFLLDRSGSMHLRVGASDTRWSLTRAGLTDILAALPDATSAAMAMFPAGDAPVTCCAITSGNYIDCGACGTGELPGTEDRCDTASYAQLGVGFGPLGAAQESALESYAASADDEFYWGTPLAPALSGTLQSVMQLGLDGVTSLVLLTDGLPTSCDTDADPTANDIGRALNAAAHGADAGIRTYVVGIDAEASSTDPATDLATNLSALAVAGSTSRYAGCEAGSDCAYVVNSDNFEQALAEALEEIALEATTCAFDVPEVDGGYPAFDEVNVTVKIGSSETTILRDPAHQNGWDYLPGNEQLQLYGDACELLKDDAAAKVAIVIGCQTEQA